MAGGSLELINHLGLITTSWNTLFVVIARSDTDIYSTVFIVVGHFDMHDGDRGQSKTTGLDEEWVEGVASPEERGK